MKTIQPPRIFPLPNISACCCHSLSVSKISKDKVLAMTKKLWPPYWHYPRATEKPLPHGRAAAVPRRAFFRAALINFAILQLVFLSLFAYIFGSLYQQAGHTHNMKILYVDYDGDSNGESAIGNAVSAAYQELESSTFPTVVQASPSEFPISGNLETAVCGATYWAAIYTSPGASSRLQNALAAGGAVAESYNRSDALTYIWNEARYSTVADSAISANLQLLSNTARLAYAAANVRSTLQTLNSTDEATILLFSNPWQLTNVNIQPTTQGSRAVYNTLVIILILIQEFFYLGIINGLYAQFKIYARIPAHRIIIVRNINSLAYTLLGSLCVAGMVWAFRAGWTVNGNQFALTWVILWLFAHANFLALDIFTIWVPPQFVPVCLINWIIFNVTSILLPFDLSPAFYRWAYVMPAHEVYQVLVDIWSGGCNPQLRYALPILFSWEVIGLAFSTLGVYRRCHYAVIAEEAQENAFNERLNTAMAFEKKRDEERKKELMVEMEEKRGSESPTFESQEERDDRIQVEEKEQEDVREELTSVIRNENEQLQRERTRKASRVDFGPSFDLAYRSSTS
jgi:hypothetical protein